MIQARQLMLRYSTGKTALSGITLNIAKGRFVYLTGESGAGKSSLLRCLYGDLRPTSGQLSVQRLDLRMAKTRQVRKLRRSIGVTHRWQTRMVPSSIFPSL